MFFLFLLHLPWYLRPQVFSVTINSSSLAIGYTSFSSKRLTASYFVLSIRFDWMKTSKSSSIQNLQLEISFNHIKNWILWHIIYHCACFSAKTAKALWSWFWTAASLKLSMKKNINLYSCRTDIYKYINCTAVLF